MANAALKWTKWTKWTMWTMWTMWTNTDRHKRRWTRGGAPNFGARRGQNPARWLIFCLVNRLRILLNGVAGYVDLFRHNIDTIASFVSRWFFVHGFRDAARVRRSSLPNQ